MTVSDEGWRSLHPLSIAVNLVPRLFRVFRGAWPLLLAAWWGREPDYALLADFVVILAMFGLATFQSALHWATLRFRIHDGRLEVIHGLVFTQTRTLDPDRIQDVEQVRNIFHRALGLVEVRIDTAAGQGVEGLLSALSKEDADALTAEIRALRSAKPDAEPHRETEVVIETGIFDLVRYGATGTRLGAGIALVFVTLDVLQWWLRADLGGLYERTGVVVLGAFGFLGAWAIGVLGAVYNYYGFRLLREGGALIAEQGLITTRRVELRPDKVQLVTLEEPLLRRFLGFGSMIIHTAAAAEAGGTAVAEALVPVVEPEERAAVFATALPALHLEQLTFERPPPIAIVPYLVTQLIGIAMLQAVLAVALAGNARIYATLLIGGLAILGIVNTLLAFPTYGFSITDDFVVVRAGFFVRRHVVVRRRKFQTAALAAGPITRLCGLAVVVVHIAGGGVALPPMPAELARSLFEQIRPRLAAKPPDQGMREVVTT